MDLGSASAEVDVAVEAARRAGKLLLERFRGEATGVTSKTTPTDLVSDADRAAEGELIAILTEAFPEDAIEAEEGAGREGTSGRRWVIDPLDGTVNFLYGIGWWAVSIALIDADGDRVGVVHAPPTGETFVAERNQGAALDGTTIRVSGVSEPERALIATGFAYDSEARRRQADVVAKLLPRVRDVRRMGSAALDLCSLAAGRVDGFYEAHLEEWDKAAGRLLVEEAGGLVAEIGPPIPGLSPGLVAAGPGIFDELKGMVSG